MAQTFSSDVTVSGTVTSATVAWGGNVNVVAGGEVVSLSLQEDSEQANDPIINVSLGGSAVDTVVRAGGGLIVNPGGKAENSLIDYNGVLLVDGAASQTTITAGGAELVDAAGISTGSTISGGLGQGTTDNLIDFSEGRQLVISGGRAENSFIASAGISDVYNGGTASHTTISMSGTSIIHDYGISENLVVQNGGQAIIEAGGTLQGAMISAGATLLALPGAVISEVSGTGTIITGGVVKLVTEEGISPEITYLGFIQNGGQLVSSATEYAYHGGQINGLTATNSGTLIAASGGILNSDVVGTVGTAIITGGITNNLTLVTGGTATLTAGGKSFFTSIQEGGSQTVLSLSNAVDTTIQLDGTQYISNGGLATDSTIALGGLEVIQQGGVSSNPQIAAGGVEIVNSGGSVINPIVQNGGLLINLSGSSITGGSGINLENAVIDINKITGNFVDVENSPQVSIATGHLAVIAGSPFGVENITVGSGGTLDIAAGASLTSVELDGGLINVTSGGHIGNVTIEIGTPGDFTQAANSDISTLLNSELRSIPTGTTINVVFNPGDYGAASTIYLGSNTSIVGSGATLGALVDFSGPALFSNYDQRVNSDTWTINNIDGSTSVVEGGIAGGELANIAVTTNNVGMSPSTTLNAELPIRTTEYAQSDNSTPIVDQNISIHGMTLVESGTSSPTGLGMTGTEYGSVGRGIWLTDTSNVSIDGNVMIAGYSGMSLVDDSNIVVANNIIIGSVVTVDAWSGTSNFVAEDNLLWEYSKQQTSGSTGAIQLNASDNTHPSSPGLNNNGTTTNDGLIGNSISGIGSPTASIAVDPLYAYGPTSESAITEQGNIDNALGNNSVGFYTANVQNATIADNVYAGGPQAIINTDSAPGIVQTSITTAYGIVSGNVALNSSGTTATPTIINNNIDPTTVDNAVFGGSPGTAGSIATWGFTGTSTSVGNLVTGPSSTLGANTSPPIFISTAPYVFATTDLVQFSGTLAPQITDSNNDIEISVTLSTTFGTVSSQTDFGTQFHTIINGRDALVLQGSLEDVNHNLASLQYSVNSGNSDDALEIVAHDSAGFSMTHYLPILWDANHTTNPSPTTTLIAGFIASPDTGPTLTGATVIATENSVINMGTTVSAVFASTGDDTINAGAGPEYISTGQGTSQVNLGSNGAVTIVGGAGSLIVNGTEAGTSSQSLIETGQSNSTITGGGGAISIVGGQGDLTFNGGFGPVFLTTAPEGGGMVSANLGTGNSTVYALSGNSIFQTQTDTKNILSLGSGNSTVVSAGADLINAGSGSLYLEATGSAQDTVISSSGRIIAKNVGTKSDLNIAVASQGATIDVTNDSRVTITGSNNTVSAAKDVHLNNVIFSGTNSNNVIDLSSHDFLSSIEGSDGSNNRLNVNGYSNGGDISGQFFDTVSMGGGYNYLMINKTNVVSGLVANVDGFDFLEVRSDDNSINGSGGATLSVFSDSNTVTGSNTTLIMQGDKNIVNLVGNATVSDASPWSYLNQYTVMSAQNEFTVQGGQFNLGCLDTLLQTSSSAALTLSGGNSVTLNGGNDSIVSNAQVYGGNDIFINGANDTVNLVNVSGSVATINASQSTFVTATDFTGPAIGRPNTNSDEQLMFIGGSGSSSTVMAGSSNTQVTVFGGSSLHNVVYGGRAGNNVLNGGSGGGDLFFAGGNLDLLIGGSSGNNTLVSATGNETLTGASFGNDIFSITGGGGTDVIRDFTGLLYLTPSLSVVKEAVISGSQNVILNDGTTIIFKNLANINQHGNIFSAFPV